MRNINMSIQSAREAFHNGGGKLKAAAGDTFDQLSARFDKVKASNGHVADLRRIRAEAASWAATHTEKTDWNADRDGPAYDAAMAFIDMVDITIANMTTIEAAIGGGAPANGSGWINAKTKEPVKLYMPDERIAPQANDVGIGELLEGMLFGARNDKVRAALESGTNTAGGYTVPETITREFIDKLRAASVFVQAGARTVMLDGGVTKIVRLDTDPTATWRDENDSIGDSDITVGAVQFDPYSLSTLVKVPYELLNDSVNIADILSRALIGSLSVELDRACLFGAGTSEPLGVFSTSGINSVSMGTNGATPTSYDDMLDMLYELEVDNAKAPTAAIWHPRTARTYRKLKDTTNQPLEAPDPLGTLPKLSTTAVPIDQTQGTATTQCSTVLMGDWTEAILGMRENLTILRLDQTFAANGQIGFWARLRADVGFAHGASFCKLIGIKP